MKNTVFLLCCLLWVGTAIGQTYVCSDPSLCGQCPDDWIPVEIQYDGIMEDSEICTVNFSWDYIWQAPLYNPLLTFICHYLSTGDTCNSMVQNRCGSCQNYTITGLNVTLNPFLSYTDSCNKFFDLFLYDICLGITTVPPPPPTVDPFYCPNHTLCFGCPLDYDKPNFTFIESIPTPGFCDLTISWEWLYDPINADNPSFDFACLYDANGEYCTVPKSLCGSCRNVTFYNLELDLNPYIDFIDTCGHIEQYHFDDNCLVIPPSFKIDNIFETIPLINPFQLY